MKQVNSVGSEEGERKEMDSSGMSWLLELRASGPVVESTPDQAARRS